MSVLSANRWFGRWPLVLMWGSLNKLWNVSLHQSLFFHSAWQMDLSVLCSSSFCVGQFYLFLFLASIDDLLELISDWRWASLNEFVGSSIILFLLISLIFMLMTSSGTFLAVTWRFLALDQFNYDLHVKHLDQFNDHLHLKHNERTTLYAF